MPRMPWHFDRLSPFDGLRMHGHFDRLSANGLFQVFEISKAVLAGARHGR
jgi:hypothetical protein